MVESLYTPAEAARTLWVHIEYESDGITKVSQEMLSKARAIAEPAGWTVGALLLGDRPEPFIPSIEALGAQEIHLVKHPLLKDPLVETHARAAAECILREKPAVILFGATPFGRDLAGRLAVRFRTGLTADCLDFSLKKDSDTVVARVSGFGGGVMALIEIPQHRPQMMTIRPGVFEISVPKRPGRASVRNHAVDFEGYQPRMRMRRRVRQKTPDLTAVPFLVIGGRGMHGDFRLLREIARLLGGEVAATRPPVDEGYVERDRQIGQTGLTVRPKVALVCGASGAFQFTVGIQQAGTIIAINIDEEAPIFEAADYGLVGDVFEILPRFMKILKQKRTRSNPRRRRKRRARHA